MSTLNKHHMQQITHGASTGSFSVGQTGWRCGAPWLLALALLAGAPACVGTIVGPELGDVEDDGSTRDPGADGAPGDTPTNPNDDDQAQSPVDSAVTYQCDRAAPSGQVYYVATSGNDSTGDGSSARPWATIGHAVESAADGATVLVRPGTYQGTVRVEGHFAQGLTVRSEVPYQARLRSSSGHVMRCFACSGITIEGFDMAHDNSSSAGPLVFQIQGDSTHHVTVRDNILHDSYNNDVLKVNNGAAFVTVERNVFYNQRGSDEHIDVNSVSDVVIQDNVFLNDFAASGRTNGNDTSSYIVIKDSNADDDRFVGARRITVRRNVFMSWEGSLATNYVLVGEDAADYIEASEVLIENNLMLGNSPNVMKSPLGVKSGHDVVFRNNTVVGDLPAGAYAMRLNVENPVVQNNNIMLFNNIWADPTGTMNRFSATPVGETGTYALDNNLYWNGGQALPLRAGDMINYSNDSQRVEGDPQLGGQAGLIAPTWNGMTFNDGSSDSCAVFEHLVALYGTPAAGSAAIDRARADNAPDHDILGRPRQSPDIGAVERQ